MRFLLTGIAFLFPLLTPVYCLQCIKCSGSSEKDCIGSSITCENPAHVCHTVHEDLLMDALQVQIGSYFERGCREKNLCDISGMFSSIYARRRVKTTCCNTDLCRPSNPSLPESWNLEKNGKTCPSCWSTETFNCVSIINIDCIGDEEHCYYATNDEKVFYDGEIFYYNASQKGCASRSTCDIKHLFIEQPTRISKINITCSGIDNGAFDRDGGGSEEEDNGSSITLSSIVLLMAIFVTYMAS